VAGLGGRETGLSSDVLYIHERSGTGHRGEKNVWTTQNEAGNPIIFTRWETPDASVWLPSPYLALIRVEKITE